MAVIDLVALRALSPVPASRPSKGVRFPAQSCGAWMLCRVLSIHLEVCGAPARPACARTDCDEVYEAATQTQRPRTLRNWSEGEKRRHK
eukprot:3686246-Pyramimonas_sp.AAC.2